MCREYPQENTSCNTNHVCVVDVWRSDLSILETNDLLISLDFRLVDERGQIRTARWIYADRLSTVTQITTLYDCGEQKSISERTACRMATRSGYKSRLSLSAENVDLSTQWALDHQICMIIWIADWINGNQELIDCLVDRCRCIDVLKIVTYGGWQRTRWRKRLGKSSTGFSVDHWGLFLFHNIKASVAALMWQHAV